MSLVISVQIMDPSMMLTYVGIVAFDKLWRIIVSKLMSLTIPVIFVPNTVCLPLYGTYGGAGVAQWQSVMMLSKSYGMFWVQTQPCTPEQLEKSAATDHTVCVYTTLIVCDYL